MKTLLTSFLLALVALSPVWAQQTVDAKDIIAKLNRKEAVSYQNVTINGDLDLTSLANRKLDREGNWVGETEFYRSAVEVPVSFRNCTFRGKFLAYYSEENKFTKNTNKVFNADFREAVTIENCTFEDDAAFKYSDFRQRALFTGNTFRELALFKYARFNDAADFSGSKFRGYADFKYTKFNEASAFGRATFGRYADFKYTKFDEPADFRDARFSDMASFKYTHMPRGTTFDNAAFEGKADFKYATLGGRKFSPDR